MPSVENIIKIESSIESHMDPLHTPELVPKLEEIDIFEDEDEDEDFGNDDDDDNEFEPDSEQDDNEPLIKLKKKPRRRIRRRTLKYGNSKIKIPRPITCGDLCKQKCREKFTETQRKLMCEHYWNLSPEERTVFIRDHVKAKIFIKLKRKRKTDRGNTSVYYLEDPTWINSPHLRVCRSYFVTTLSLTYYILKKALDGYEMQPEPELEKPLHLETKEDRRNNNQYIKNKERINKSSEVEHILDPVTGNLVIEKKENKYKRMRGQPDKHFPKPISCVERCLHKCHLKFTEEQRKLICSYFWSIDYKRRKDFILSHMETRAVQSVLTPEFRKSNRSSRSHQTRFYLRAGLSGENQRVCQKFFTATLCITRRVIVNALEFADQSTGYYMGTDRRGQNAISDERIHEIKQHIGSYPTWTPNKRSKIRYLHSSLSIKRLYTDYKTKCLAEQKKFVSHNFFYSIFHNAFQLAFLRPVAPPNSNGKTKFTKGFLSLNPNISNFTGEEPGGYWCNAKGEILDTNTINTQMHNFSTLSDTNPSNSASVIPPDRVPEQSTIDFSKNSTEEEIDKASELRSEAAAAYSEQRYGEAIDFYTQAIELNPGNALFHAKRGQAFLKLQKPNACIRDCNRALAINCDSAAAYKFRGRAHRLLGNWEEAAKDLRQACKLDFDEEADEWLREVTPNAKKIEQHRLKQQRKKDERDRKAREVRREKARTEASQQQQQQEKHDNTSMPGGLSAGANLIDLLSSISDPEIMAALQDILKNPVNIEKYKSNPKLANIIDVFKSSFPGGVGGFPGGFPGSFPSTAGANDADDGNTATAPPNSEDNKPQSKKPDFVDDGLD